MGKKEMDLGYWIEPVRNTVSIRRSHGLALRVYAFFDNSAVQSVQCGVDLESVF